MKTKIIFVLLLFFLLSANSVFATDDIERCKNVLVIHSYNLGHLWTHDLHEAIVDYFKQDLSVFLQVEFLDTKFHPDINSLFKFYANLFKEKYANSKIDCIIVSGDGAYSFLLQYADEIFGPEVPIVFCGINNFSPDSIGTKLITGIVEVINIQATVDLALKLNSNTQNIVIFNDLSQAGLITLSQINSFIDKYKSQYHVDIITDMTMAEIKTFLTNLKQNTVVIVVGYNRDGNNEFIKSVEMIKLIKSSCEWPIYSCWDYMLNYGVVGGMITSARDHGYHAAIYADKILNGVSARDIPVYQKNLNKIVFDYNQITANKISLSNFNEKYKIINSPFEYIVEYRPYLIYIVIVILVLFVIILLLSVNIFKRKYIESQFIESKMNFESLIVSMNEGFFMQSKNEIIEFVNDKFCSMLELSKDDLLGSQISNFIAREDIEHFFYELNNNLDSNSDINIEVSLFSRSQGLINTIMSPKKHYAPDGTYKGISCVVTDITELKNIQRTLSYEKERLYTTLDSIGDGVITTDMNGAVTFCNKVAENITGWEYEIILNRNINEVYIRFDSKTSKLVDGLSTLARKKNVVSDLMLQTRSGELVNIEETIATIVDESGHSRGNVIVFRDITNRKVIEDEIIKSQKIESIGLLAGSLAHDFNNILSGVVGNLYMAKTYIRLGNLNPQELMELITDMEQASERAKKLTAQMLTFAKGGVPVCKDIDIKELLMKSSQFALVGSENIKLKFDIDPCLHFINADEGQIDQVINNLIINANQAMPDGGSLTIIAENFFVDEESQLPLTSGNYVKIQIKDTGTGITPENLKKIYDPYFTTKVKGYGIGLASTFSIINKHSGYITCDSEVGVGTTFTFYLPAVDTPPEWNDHIQKQKEHYNSKENQKIKILLMDDNDDVRLMNARLLTYFGFIVDVASDGDEAVELFKNALKSKSKYDVCILDLVIPGKKNGDKVLADLLEIDPNVKSILTSGYSVDPVVADYKKIGYSAVLSKPYRIESLIEIIKDLTKH